MTPTKEQLEYEANLCAVKLETLTAHVPAVKEFVATAERRNAIVSQLKALSGEAQIPEGEAPTPAPAAEPPKVEAPPT